MLEKASGSHRVKHLDVLQRIATGCKALRAQRIVKNLTACRWEQHGV